MQRWAGAVNQALADPAFRARLLEAGFEAAGGTPAAAAALVRAEIARYGEVIRRADIRLD